MKIPLRIALIATAGITALALTSICILKGNRSRTEPDRRGNICDMNGETIATSGTVYDISLDCMLIEDVRQWGEKTMALASGE